MKYSEILGSGFYGIRLAKPDRQLVDIFFVGASHHFWRWKEQCGEGSDSVFHLSMHRAHLRALIGIVFHRGDFSAARDPSGFGLDRREAWNPEFLIMPDPQMFDSMCADGRYSLGEAHPSDAYLADPSLKERPFDERPAPALGLDPRGRPSPEQHQRPVVLKLWRSPGDDDSVLAIRNWVQSMGINPDQIEQESEREIRWHLVQNGVSYVAALYRYEETDEAHFFLESAIGRLQPLQAGPVAKWISDANCKMALPLRLGIRSRSLVVVQCRAHCQAFTPFYFRQILEQVAPLSEELFIKLHDAFGVQPFSDEGDHRASGKAA